MSPLGLIVISCDVCALGRSPALTSLLLDPTMVVVDSAGG
jgi:hypothetical protein